MDEDDEALSLMAMGMQALLVCQAVAQQDADREDEQQRKKSRNWKGRKNYREST